MMKLTKKTLSLLLGATLVVGAVSAVQILDAPVATAQASAKSIVDAAKASGEVGEQADGYLGLVGGNVSSGVRAAVNEINIRRKFVYTDLARQQSVSVEAVSQLMAEKLIAKAPSGTWIKDGSGKWLRK
ncbi:MAG: YdbL family protein [Robiginitomaculum sp.]